VSEDVTKDVNLVVVGGNLEEAKSRKIVEARAKGVELWSEQQWKAIL
jgi:NAD-dependent DNA ligase